MNVESLYCILPITIIFYSLGYGNHGLRSLLPCFWITLGDVVAFRDLIMEEVVRTIPLHRLRTQTLRVDYQQAFYLRNAL